MTDGAGPLVTVGLPVYNGERFIAHAIEAILTQTYGNLELVISDNGSTDGTEAICRSRLSRDPRVRYARSSVNRGMSWNYARLVQLARGKYFKWIAADDSCDADFLAKCVAVLERDPTVVLACTKTIFIDEAGRAVQRIDPEWDLRSEMAHERLEAVILKGGHWENADALSGVIRTDALRRTRRIPPYQGGDKRPLAELSLMGKFVEIPEYLLFRRRHAGASNTNNPATRGYDARSVRWMTEFFQGSPWRVCLPTWNLTLDQVVTIYRSRLGAKATLRLLVAELKGSWWRREVLMQELGAVRRMLVATLFGWARWGKPLPP